MGATDAEELVKEFTPYFTEEDLVNLAKFKVYMKLMIDGVSSSPFSASTLAPVSGKTDNLEKIVTVSRERYTRPRSVVEEKIARWTLPDALQKKNIDGKPGDSSQSQNTKPAVKKLSYNERADLRKAEEEAAKKAAAKKKAPPVKVPPRKILPEVSPDKPIKTVSLRSLVPKPNDKKQSSYEKKDNQAKK